MLVLTRKIGEAITIGENIRVTVKHLSGGAVKLGVEAPNRIQIARVGKRLRM